MVEEHLSQKQMRNTQNNFCYSFPKRGGEENTEKKKDYCKAFCVTCKCYSFTTVLILTLKFFTTHLHSFTYVFLFFV